MDEFEDSKTEDPTTMGFGSAMEELESILKRVEGEEIDIDELAVELQRAAALLETCRTKIRRAEVEVSQIVQSLDGGETTAEVEPKREPSSPAETASLFHEED